MTARRDPGCNHINRVQRCEDCDAPLTPDHEPTPDEVELMGLSVMTTVLDRMSLAERSRCLAYLVDRFGDGGWYPRLVPTVYRGGIPGDG